MVKKILGAILVAFVVVCFFCVGKLRKFAQDSRESQRAALIAAGAKAPALVTPGPEVATESSDKSEKETQPSEDNQVSAAATASASDASEYTTAEFIQDIQKKPLIETCSMLGGERTPLFKKIIGNPRGFKILVLDQMLELGTLAYRLPINQVVALQVDENPSLLQDVRYAIDIYRARKELEANLPFARQIETRGYYTRVLAKIAKQNPNILGDSALSGLCDKFANTQSPLSQEEMNREVYAFMERAQVNPADIDFNPNYKPTVEISKSIDGVGIYFPKRTKK